MIHPVVATVQTAAGGGGTADVRAGGRLIALALDYDAAAAVGTTVTVTFPDVPGTPQVSVPAGNTDRVVYPRVGVHDMAGAAIAGRGEEAPLVYGRAIVTVASAGAALNPAVTARLFFE